MSRLAQRIEASDIYDRQGRRKYLTARERQRFRACAETLRPEKKAFCLIFYYTGLRISEALELTRQSLDLSDGVIVIRCLKRRQENLYRSVPVPGEFLKLVCLIANHRKPAEPLWPFSRSTGYRLIKKVMKSAQIKGIQACPRGLRHGFGIACAQNDVPLPTIAKWMGHSTIQTTTIYLNAVGKEERQFAKRIW